MMRTQEECLLPAEFVIRNIRARRRVRHVGFSLRNSIKNQLAVHHFECIAGKSNDPLHEILCAIDGPLENDNVAALRRAERRKLDAGERNLGAIDKLVHEKKIANLERSLHAPGWDLERLDEK